MQHRKHVWTSANAIIRVRPCTLICRRHILAPTSKLAQRDYSSQHDASSHNIAILGGGISGLASAYYITKALPRAKVTIYESQDRLGGWIKSTRVPVQGGSVLFESASRTLRPNENGVLSLQLMQELDLANDAIFVQKTAAAATSRYVYYPDRLVKMPHPSQGLADNLWSIFTDPVFAGLWYQLPMEWFKPPRDANITDESVGSFLSRRFGPDMVDRLASAMMHGIYAGDVWQLSAKSILPALWRSERSAGGLLAAIVQNYAEGREVTERQLNFVHKMQNFSWEPRLRAAVKFNSVFTFKDGLYMLVERLVQNLAQSGNVQFKTSTPVSQISISEDKSQISVTTTGAAKPADFTHVISSLPPWHLNGLHQSSAEQREPLISKIPTVTTMVVSLYYRTPNLHPPGFGYLIPQATPFENNPERALGVIFDTAYSPTTEDLNINNWANISPERLEEARERKELLAVNDFSWYNMPHKPNTQDHVQKTGSKLTVMLGGHWWNDWPAYPSEEEGLAMAKSILARHLNITEEPEVWQVQLNKDCIPQFTVGHEDRLRAAHTNISREYRNRLRVVGNWMWGVGVNDSLRSAWEAAESFKAGRDGTGLEHIVTKDYVRVKLHNPSQSQEKQ